MEHSGSHQHASFFQILGVDIAILEILKYLDYRELLVAAQVCKEWRTFILEGATGAHLFVNLHLQKYANLITVDVFESLLKQVGKHVCSLNLKHCVLLNPKLEDFRFSILNRSDLFDPSLSYHLFQKELKERAAEIIAKYCSAENLRSINLGVIYWDDSLYKFRNLEKITIELNKLTHIDFSHFPNLKHYKNLVEATTWSSITSLATHCTQLQSLSFFVQNNENLENLRFITQQLKSLRRLELPRTNLDSFTSSITLNMPHLEILIGRFYQTENVKLLINKCPNLKCFDASFIKNASELKESIGNLKSVAVQICSSTNMEGAFQNKQLELLKLEGEKQHIIDFLYTEKIAAENLTTLILDIVVSYTRESHLSMVEFISRCKNLEKLHILHVEFTLNDIEAMLSYPSFSSQQQPPKPPPFNKWKDVKLLFKSSYSKECSALLFKTCKQLEKFYGGGSIDWFALSELTHLQVITIETNQFVMNDIQIFLHLTKSPFVALYIDSNAWQFLSSCPSTKTHLVVCRS
jgi:hypothetical protein